MPSRDLSTSVSKRVWEASVAFGLALAGGDRFPNINNWNDVVIRRHSFWHRVDVTAIVAATDIEVFGVNGSQFVSNLPKARSLPADMIFFLTSPRVRITRGYNVAGTAQAASEIAQYSVSAFDADSNNCAADIATLYEHGNINLNIGGFPVLRDQYGLWRLPCGGGPTMEGWMSSGDTTATTKQGGSVANTNNGVPHANNGYQMAPFFAFGPGDEIDCKIKYNFARTLAASLVLYFELDGYAVSSS